jgi:hypothetical protein
MISLLPLPLHRQSHHTCWATAAQQQRARWHVPQVMTLRSLLAMMVAAAMMMMMMSHKMAWSQMIDASQYSRCVALAAQPTLHSVQIIISLVSLPGTLWGVCTSVCTVRVPSPRLPSARVYAGGRVAPLPSLYHMASVAVFGGTTADCMGIIGARARSTCPLAQRPPPHNAPHPLCAAAAAAAAASGSSWTRRLPP